MKKHHSFYLSPVMGVTTSAWLLLLCCCIFSTVNAITSESISSPADEQVIGIENTGRNDEEAGSLPSESYSYGSRLAEAQFQAFGNQMFHNTLMREPQREESPIYSSGINAILNSDGFLNQMEKLNGGDPKYTPHGPVEMAVHSKKTVEVIPVKFEEPKDGEPQVIEISPYEVPVSIVFKTQTNKLHVNQEHKTEAAEEVKEIQSEEEPQRVVHNIYRPVIQEVTEVVQPYRKVLQKVEPVIEEMKTIIAKAGPPPETAMMQQRPQQIAYGDSSIRAGQLGRFSTADFGLSGYGSEVVNKIAPPPQQTTTSSSLSGPLLLSSTARSQIGSDDDDSSGSSVGDKPMPSPMGGSIAHVSKLEPLLADKDSNYNDIIKQYIGNLLATKQHLQQHQHRHQQPSQSPRTQSPSSASLTASNNAKHINANSIKILNIPLRNLPSANARNNHDFTKKSTAKSTTQEQQQPSNNELVSDNNNKKFKIIKEFRISLADIKKELAKRSGSGGGSFAMIKPFIGPSQMMASASTPSVSIQRHHSIQQIDEPRNSRPNRNYHYMRLRRDWTDDRPDFGQRMLINLDSKRTTTNNAERRESTSSILDNYQPRNGFRPSIIRRRF